MRNAVKNRHSTLCKNKDRDWRRTKLQIKERLFENSQKDGLDSRRNQSWYRASGRSKSYAEFLGAEPDQTVVEHSVVSKSCSPFARKSSNRVQPIQTANIVKSG
ncbi:hypothetical protein R1flu_007127 [Riccia fluitans]|uniref:Uncharacterized protein n=1 Tax=Riccia fluitans TaxID=41844 RepID=A0ABD1YYS0_9MARC